MPANRSTRRRGLRLIAVLALLIVVTGTILYSARSIRYRLDGKTATEYQITKLSLTHEVDRGADGKLTNPYADAAQPTAPSPTAVKASNPPPVRTALAKSDTGLKAAAAKKPAPHKPALKKPAPKKPAPKKPALKKPAPKKPAPKKPARKAPKACPT